MSPLTLGGSQKLISLRHGGYLEYGLKVVICPGWNWVRKRGSWDQKRRMSGMEKRTMERRSRPRPKAQPDLWDIPGRGEWMYAWRYEKSDGEREEGRRIGGGDEALGEVEHGERRRRDHFRGK